jgi:hypothetical protein
MYFRTVLVPVVPFSVAFKNAMITSPKSLSFHSNTASPHLLPWRHVANTRQAEPNLQGIEATNLVTKDGRDLITRLGAKAKSLGDIVNWHSSSDTCVVPRVDEPFKQMLNEHIHAECIDESKIVEYVRKFGHGLASYSGASAPYHGVCFSMPAAWLTCPKTGDSPCSVSAALGDPDPFRRSRYARKPIQRRGREDTCCVFLTLLVGDPFSRRMAVASFEQGVVDEVSSSYLNDWWGLRRGGHLIIKESSEVCKLIHLEALLQGDTLC